MKKNTFHVQNCFAKSNQSTIKKIYNINPEENIRLAFWAGHFYSLGLRELGFVFTDKALYWNYPSTKESGSDGEITEILHIKNGILDSSSTDFSEVYTKSVEGKTSLVLKTSDLNYCFEFENSPKNLELLENALRSYFTSNLDLKQFEESDESYSVLFTFLLLKDFCGEAFLAAKTKLAQVFKKSAESTKEKVQNFADAKSEEFREWKEENDRKRAERQAFKEEAKAKKAEESKKSENVEKEQSRNPKTENESLSLEKILHFVRHTFDLCADLIFVLAVLIWIKPTLLLSMYNNKAEFDKLPFYENVKDKLVPEIDISNFKQRLQEELQIFDDNYPWDDRWINKVSERVSDDIKKQKDFKNEFIKSLEVDNFKSNFAKEILAIQNLLKYFLICIFFLIKLPVVLSCNRSRKSVSLLLLVILACITPLINSYFLIFSLVSLLVLLTLQFSMGFSKAVIQIKSCLFAVSVVCGYLTIHLIQNPGLCRQIVEWFSLPAKWW